MNDLLDRQLIPASVVARILGVSPKSVRRWATDGLLPSYRFGGTVRFDAAEVAEWLGRQRGEVT